MSANDPRGLKAQTPEQIHNLLTDGVPDNGSILIGGGGSAMGHGLGTGDDGGSFGSSDYYKLSGQAAFDFIFYNGSDYSGNYSYSSANVGAGSSNSGDFLHNNLQTVGVMSSTVYKGTEFVDGDGATWSLNFDKELDLTQNAEGINNTEFGTGFQGNTIGFNKIKDGVISGAQLATDVSQTTWTGLSKIAGASEVLVDIGERATIAGIAISVMDAGGHILSGNGTWRDGVTLVGALFTAVALGTGVGEIVVGVGVVAWDICNIATSPK